MLAIRDEVLVEKIQITDAEFRRVQALLMTLSGISLSDNKKILLMGRLNKRLVQLGLSRYGQYLDLVQRPGQAQELQLLLDALTTNETYFFREVKHLEFLADVIVPAHRSGEQLKIWSAAASSGEEAYSIAMVLARSLGIQGSWQILGTDINQAVIERARTGVYPISAAEKIPLPFLRDYCLKGVADQATKLMIDPALSAKVRFEQFNLNGDWRCLDQFDVIFLRNVMIYFNTETKRKLIERIYRQLKPGGYLIVGHAESLYQINDCLTAVKPSIYRRV
ncbi:chemotaxis protein CheR [Oleiphilus messinensis]|uniref:Chemotaxis protein methyltransferase n=1 Tax=Oleiphilus messinensis TaxID=141451 RepID=A0A1Y0IIN7_9GAMM|nr:protein-glutamate O-methyltransferase CheR [Oleiphilus messinensis]ARU59385.1 chemotaxis protein CheR [Oleiphilus messinensis]